MAITKNMTITKPMTITKTMTMTATMTMTGASVAAEFSAPGAGPKGRGLQLDCGSLQTSQLIL